jgi:hypothetical protein
VIIIEKIIILFTFRREGEEFVDPYFSLYCFSLELTIEKSLDIEIFRICCLLSCVFNCSALKLSSMTRLRRRWRSLNSVTLVQSFILETFLRVKNLPVWVVGRSPVRIYIYLCFNDLYYKISISY